MSVHFDSDEYTEEELEEIKRFAEFVKSKAQSQQYLKRLCAAILLIATIRKTAPCPGKVLFSVFIF